MDDWGGKSIGVASKLWWLSMGTILSMYLYFCVIGVAICYKFVCGAG